MPKRTAKPKDAPVEKKRVFQLDSELFESWKKLKTGESNNFVIVKDKHGALELWTKAGNSQHRRVAIQGIVRSGTDIVRVLKLDLDYNDLPLLIRLASMTPMLQTFDMNFAPFAVKKLQEIWNERRSAYVARQSDVLTGD